MRIVVHDSCYVQFNKNICKNSMLCVALILRDVKGPMEFNDLMVGQLAFSDCNGTVILSINAS